jgi:hypothetical protein
VQILSALCADGTIAAHLEIERVDLSQVFGPQRLPERPETDEPEAPPEPATTQAAAGAGR